MHSRTNTNISSRGSGSCRYILAASSTEFDALTTIATGLVRTRNAGTATISATLGIVQGLARLDVSAAVLQTIAITPAVTIGAGYRFQLAANGSFSDGSTHDVSSMVKWASSDTGVA